MAQVYLLLGGNQGDRDDVFRSARMLLAEQIGCATTYSAVYETEPWGFESDELFWNQVLIAETTLTPSECLKAIHVIEQQLGRERKTQQYCSRPMDIDILFYDDRIIDTAELIVPHPRMHERRFALQPLAELVPDMEHPLLRKSISRLLDECTDQLMVRKLQK